MMNNTTTSTNSAAQDVLGNFDQEAERQLFELHYGPKDSFAWRTPDGKYKSAALQSAWEIWQASAQARRAASNVVAGACAVSEFEHLELSRKAAYWWDALLKCARMLDVPVEHSIPDDVVEGMEQLLAQQPMEAGPKDSARDAEVLKYLAGQVQLYTQELKAAALLLSAEKYQSRAENILRDIESTLRGGTVPAAQAGHSAIPVLQTKQQAEEAIKVCNALTDVVGDDEQHPLFPLMNALMDGIRAWEDADPELQAFFGTGENNESESTQK